MSLVVATACGSAKGSADSVDSEGEDGLDVATDAATGLEDSEAGWADGAADSLDTGADDVDAGGDFLGGPVCLGALSASGDCADPFIKVSEGDSPIGPTTSCACPPPYVSTCGACPWLGIPETKQHHVVPSLLWTGNELLLFAAGAGSPGGGLAMNAERWQPSDGSGFQQITLPAELTSVTNLNCAQAVWTGKEAVVLTDRPFHYDPKTGAFATIPALPLAFCTVTALAPYVFVHGTSATVNGASKPVKHSFYRLDTQTWQWSDVPFPSQYFDESKQSAYLPGGCHAALDGGLFMYGQAFSLAPGSGLDPSMDVMLRLDIVKLTWSAVAQPAGPRIPCVGQVALFAAFPAGIALYGEREGSSYYSQKFAGRVWHAGSNTWTDMAASPAWAAAVDGTGSIWTGSQFVVPGLQFFDPVFSKPKPGGDPYFNTPWWPLLYDPAANQWSYTTGMGAPKGRRTSMSFVYTGAELIGTGGYDETYTDKAMTDGYRLYLPPTPTADYSSVLP